MPAPVPPDLPANPRFEKARGGGGALARQLAAYDAMLREERPAAWQAYERLVERLCALDVGAGAPKAGDRLPSFDLPDDQGRLVSSGRLVAEGPLVLSFNRGSWCPYCWLELAALQDCLGDIRAGGGAVVSITPEIATFSRRLKRRLGLEFPCLSDLDNGYALALGLAHPVGADIREIYRGAGIDLGAFQRSDAWFLPLPATLVVDRRGIVRHAYVNADFRERIDPKEIPDLLSGL